VQARLDPGIAAAKVRPLARIVKHGGKERCAAIVRVRAVPGGGHSAHEAGAPMAEGVVHSSDAAVVVPADGGAARRLVRLHEEATPSRRAVQVPAQVGQQVRRELDVALAGAEQGIQPQIRLYCTCPSAVAKVAGAPLADQRAARLYPSAQAIGRRLRQHHREGEV